MTAVASWFVSVSFHCSDMFVDESLRPQLSHMKRRMLEAMMEDGDLVYNVSLA